MPGSKGKFITFEGGDCTGKSTQVQLLADLLRRNDRDVITTREPGGSPGAEKLRELILYSGQEWDPPTETLLHFASRLDHYMTRIAPSLKRGEWVVCDRFLDSTTVYQGWGMGVDMKVIETLNQLTLGDFRADLTLILDLPVEVMMKRLEARGGGRDRYEKMEESFHRRLRQGFLDIASSEPDRCVVIDADASRDVVFSRVAAIVETRLLRKSPV